MANPGAYADSYLSGDDTDAESRSSVHVHDGVHTENSYDTAEAESKAREAAAEQRAGSSSAAPPSQLSSPALSAISVPWSEPDIPNFNMNPPDYATATANQTTYGSMQFSPARYPLEAAQHQSMSDAVPVEVDEENGLLTPKSGRKRTRRCRPRWCGCMTTCNTVLVIAVIVLIALLSRAAESGHDKTNEGNSDPPKAPDGSENDNHNDPGTKPYFPPSECAYQHYSETQYFGFPSLSNFTLGEFMESASHLSGGIEGTVYIQPSTQPDQEVDIRLRLAYATTSPFHVVNSNYVKDHDSFNLDLPDLQKGQEGFEGRPCLSVFIGVEIRRGVKLENWAVSTGNLDIVVADGLFKSSGVEEEQSHMQVTEESSFSAIRGKAEIAYWTSRRTIIEFISGEIRGNFALRDVLSLKTVSGDIDVTVDPKRADPDRPKPAEFTAVTASGDIDAQFPTTGDIPSREFRTRLETVSASIRGTYIAGSTIAVHTISGDVSAALLPYYAADTQSVSIHTSSRSGATKLNVLPPYHHEDWPSRSSEHRSASTSGDIDITYPEQWEGTIDGQTNTGSISIKGKDVEMDDYRGKLWPVWQHITARKGNNGPGSMGLKTLSAAIRVRVGVA